MPNDFPSKIGGFANEAATSEFNDEIADSPNESFQLEIHLISKVFNKINLKVRSSLFSLPNFPLSQMQKAFKVFLLFKEKPVTMKM